MKIVWSYDISCEDMGICVADSNDQEFETKEEALADAHDYIISELSDEYEMDVSSFNVTCYSKEVSE